MLEFYTTQVYASSDEIVGGIGKIELALESDLDIGLDRDFNRNLLSSNRSNYKLVRKVTSNLLSPKAIDPDEQVLCRNVVSLNLRYFDGTRWVDEWDSIEDSNSLPRAVEIDIEVVDTTRSRYKSSTATATRTDDLPKRRLIQSFAIPCGLTAVTEEE
jgi:hypothetical protein